MTYDKSIKPGDKVQFRIGRSGPFSGTVNWVASDDSGFGVDLDGNGQGVLVYDDDANNFFITKRGAVDPEVGKMYRHDDGYTRLVLKDGYMVVATNFEDEAAAGAIGSRFYWGGAFTLTKDQFADMERVTV